MKAIVAFDDTGSDHLTASRTLERNRKTYVAVVMRTKHARRLSDHFKRMQTRIKKEFGSFELHFVDIVNGNGDWKEVDFESRIKLFEDICSTFPNIEVPCFVQTWSPNHYEKNKMVPENLPDFEVFDKTNYEHFAFYVSLLKSVKYVCSEKWVPAKFICDEGMRKAGSKIEMKLLQNITKSSAIHFESSSENVYLQIADLAAYIYNRHQNFAVKENKGPIDKRIIIAAQNLGFKYSDTEVVTGQPDDIDVELYDFVTTMKHSSVHG
ncbi:DUF3800 domain-containing protein [Vibrio barjaei]|uniref:DUF3800 domain-containing protein n=1 Tax=Vibrio barjaei TaxID=1676683 RepID=UPI0007BC7AE7|nr:DUF3800 domain-containing protein [Vibrio barjaei]OIN27963.1 hypothetical protein AWH66_2011480 [Vibrio barjaei]